MLISPLYKNSLDFKNTYFCCWNQNIWGLANIWGACAPPGPNAEPPLRTAISISRVSVLTRDKNACTGCVSTDVGTWTNWLTFEPDPDHSPDTGTGFLSPISYIYAATRNFTSIFDYWQFIVLISIFAYHVAYTQWRFATCFHYACARLDRPETSCILPLLVRLSVTKIVSAIFWKRMKRFWCKFAQVAQEASTKRSTLGVRRSKSGSHETEDRFGGLAEASFSTLGSCFSSS